MKSLFSDSQVSEQLMARGVMMVYLYGSEALGLANALSDLDVGVALRDPSVLKDSKRYLNLHTDIYGILEPALIGNTQREMDLVFIQKASPVLQFQVINAGRALFVAESVFQADYEADVMRQYRDIRNLVEVHFQTALERVA